MDINVLDIAARLESIVRRADKFGPKTRSEILDEIQDMAKDLRKFSDRELEAMAKYFGQN